MVHPMITLGEDVDQPQGCQPTHTQTLAIPVWYVETVDILRYLLSDQETQQNRDIINGLTPHALTNAFGK
jgi:hypothetical protein